MNYDWLELAKKLQSISQAGLAYSRAKYDRERYEMIMDLSAEIVSRFSNAEFDKVRDLFKSEKGYPTPKVEIRAVVFKDEKILMVQEEVDGKWALPGGWADIWLSPFEVAKKEVWEEAGINVNPVRLLAIFDKAKHDYPQSPYHIYQMFILCEYEGGELKGSTETLDAKFFQRGAHPELSVDRTIEEDLKMAWQFYDNPDKDVICD